ncbi:MAG: hypothetical protein H5T76_39920 [Streptomyces sp.]|nr:hypothetical protein [Streptomyces sp.]
MAVDDDLPVGGELGVMGAEVVEGGVTRTGDGSGFGGGGEFVPLEASHGAGGEVVGDVAGHVDGVFGGAVGRCVGEFEVGEFGCGQAGGDGGGEDVEALVDAFGADGLGAEDGYLGTAIDSRTGADVPMPGQ